MTDITLHTKSKSTVTCVSNTFIDEYMADANGEFVKVYIYLLRLLSDASIPFSLEQMADHFFCTERDIVRALIYWEKEKLLTLTYRDNEDIADIVLHVPPIKTQAAAFQTPDSILSDPSVNTSDTNVTMEMAAHSAAVRNTPVSQAQAISPAAPQAVPPNAQTSSSASASTPKSASALTPDRVKELKQNEEIVQLLYIAEQYLGKTLTPTEMKKILFFYDELKLSPDLIEYLIEYSVSRGHKSMRYIETVALAWAEEGINTVTMAKEANSRYAKEYFTIF